MLQQVVLFVDESEMVETDEKLAYVIHKQLSFFADPEGFAGFLRYIGQENDWHEIFTVIKSGFSEEEPREPF